MSYSRRTTNILLLSLAILSLGAAALSVRRQLSVHTAPAASAFDLRADEMGGLESSPSDAVDTGGQESPPSGNADTADTGRARMPDILTATSSLKPRISRKKDAGSYTAPASPFRMEAMKVAAGNLEEQDSTNRMLILDYCEHFRTAYTTKDIDFLRQVFSDDALIIVGSVVEAKPGADGMVSTAPAVKRSIRSKREYLSRLERIFASNEKVKVGFSDFRILRHPSQEGIYGVSLKQKYETAGYCDEGYLFLLWDFRNPSMPLVHVRTWQPPEEGVDPIGLGDFDLD